MSYRGVFIAYWWSHRESNPDLKFRKLPFYPLNYETKFNNASRFGELLRC